MHLDLDPAGQLHLTDPANMRAFSARAPEGGTARIAAALGASGRAEGADHVWIDPALLARLGPADQEGAWAADFAKMIAYAVSKGWTDAQGWVRAHVEPLP